MPGQKLRLVQKTAPGLYVFRVLVRKVVLILRLGYQDDGIIP